MMGLKVIMCLVQSDVFQNEARKDSSTQISHEIGRKKTCKRNASLRPQCAARRQKTP